MNNRPMVVFAGSCSTNLSHRIAHHLGIQLGGADTTPFADGESMVKIKNDVRDRDVFIIQSLARRWNPALGNKSTGINDSFMELLLWIDALKRSSAHRVTAVIPYFGYARQDRKTEGRTPISAKVVADCLAEMGCDRVLTMDLHSEQIQGFFRGKDTKLDHLNAGQIIAKHFTKLGFDNATVLSPDIGNAKKADKYRQGMPDHYDMAIIDKRRDPRTGEVSMPRVIGDIEGRTVIMLDDMIATAGTMEQATKVAADNGATGVYIAATHGIFVGPAVDRLRHPLIKEICVTDSVPMLHEIESRLPITIMSVAELFANAIKRVHEGRSIGELLGKFS